MCASVVANYVRDQSVHVHPTPCSPGSPPVIFLGPACFWRCFKKFLFVPCSEVGIPCSITHIDNLGIRRGARSAATSWEINRMPAISRCFSRSSSKVFDFPRQHLRGGRLHRLKCGGAGPGSKAAAAR